MRIYFDCRYLVADSEELLRILEKLQIEELERWKEAVQEWHLYGELKLDNLKCDSSWETVIG